jgi:murein DD-endopeptidase MepM/ murein hydrolase activator NlpD
MRLPALFTCLLGCLFLALAFACAPGTKVATPTPTPTADCPNPAENAGAICKPPFLVTRTIPPLETVLPTATGSAITQISTSLSQTPPISDTATLEPTTVPTLTPTTAPCLPDLCTYSSQFFLNRPIAPPNNDRVDLTYRFGSTQSGRREPHHGVEFLNPIGTPVLAAADGVVVVAGDDRQPTSQRGVWPITFYGPFSYFYGNLVVIEHQSPAALLQAFPNMPQPIYTLYAHLSEVSVQVGQQVKAGQEIGKVGMTGIAEGNHLHFEVRLGENTYKNSHNPELWLKPHLDENGQSLGALAGRILDSYNSNISVESLVLEHLPDGPEKPNDYEVHLLPYEEKFLIGQPPWLESFGLGDLPAGWYRLSFPRFGVQQLLVQVYPGQMTVVTIRVK